MRRLDDLDKREIGHNYTLIAERKIRREIEQRKKDIREQNDADELLAKLDIEEKAETADTLKETQIVDERLTAEEQLEQILRSAPTFDSAVLDLQFRNICAHIFELRQQEKQLEGEKRSQVQRMIQDVQLFLNNVGRQADILSTEKDLIKATETMLRDWIYEIKKEQERVKAQEEGKPRRTRVLFSA